ncbi:MAG: hypothetical protein IPO82_18600 [Betaproteobacteria bacterium]|nr:hypothetical protein [Betaproteobacteria bacterium]
MPISILATRPLRAANLAGLRVDRHVEVYADRILRSIPGEETKNRQLLECWRPHAIAASNRCSTKRPKAAVGGANIACGVASRGTSLPDWIRVARCRENCKRMRLTAIAYLV